MSRLTIEELINHCNITCERQLQRRSKYDNIVYQEHDSVREYLKELQHYKDLEEQLEKLYGTRLSLDEIVETLNMIVQNGEERLDFARILTNAEAEKWDRWKSLEEQGRLVELPCDVGDTVYVKMLGDGLAKAKVRDYVHFLTDGFCLTLTSDEFPKQHIPISEIGKTVFLTPEEAEAKLAEVEGE